MTDYKPTDEMVPWAMIEKAALALYPPGHHRLCSSPGTRECDCYFTTYTINAHCVIRVVTPQIVAGVGERIAQAIEAMVEQDYNTDHCSSPGAVTIVARGAQAGRHAAGIARATTTEVFS